MSALPFCIVYSVPLSVVTGYWLGGGWNFLTAFIAFVSIPVVDLIWGTDTRNPDPEHEKELEARKEFRWVTWGVVPVLAVVVLWGAYVVSHQPLTFIELVGFTLSVGIMTGAVGINTAHEMLHRLNHWEGFLGHLLLILVCYMHWGVEHIRGHHALVATPEDPATARFGQSFYAFWPQTVFGTMCSSWNLEVRRLQRKDLPAISLHNRIIWSAILPLLLATCLGWAWGWKAVAFFFAQSIIGFSFLEVVNYLEHYGLLRRKLPDGSYEQVTHLHSWNSSHRLTNYYLFNLQRHSDHHAKPGRRYQILRHYDDSPQLPTGYAGMVVAAWIPPLWFRIMNHRVPQPVAAKIETAG